MSDIEAEVRPWGNSLGIVVPADVVRQEGLKAHDRVLVRIIKLQRPQRGSFGSLRDLRIDAQELKDRLRREHAW